MANIKSAQKRILVAKRKQLENRTIKSNMNTSIKKYYAAINAGDTAKAEELLPITVSIVDSAASKGIIHANTAANKNGQMSKVLALLKAGKITIVQEAPKKAKAKAAAEVKAPIVEEKPAKKAKAIKEDAPLVEEKPVKKAKAKVEEAAPEAKPEKAPKKVKKEKAE